MLTIGLRLITGALITEDIDTEQELKADHAVPASSSLFSPFETNRSGGAPAPPSSLVDLYRLFDRVRNCLDRQSVLLLHPPTFTAQNITSLCLTNRSTTELPRLISCNVLIEWANPAVSAAWWTLPASQLAV